MKTLIVFCLINPNSRKISLLRAPTIDMYTGMRTIAQSLARHQGFLALALAIVLMLACLGSAAAKPEVVVSISASFP